MSKCNHEFTTSISTIKVDVEKCDNCGLEFVESVYESDVLRKENYDLKQQVNGLMQIIDSQKETNLAIIKKLEKMKCCSNCKHVAVDCDSDGCQSKGGFDDWEIRD